MVDAMACYIFYGIMPPRAPGDVPPNEIAIQLGWVSRDSNTGEAYNYVDGNEYDVWADEQRWLHPLGLELDVVYSDGYPLAHIYAAGTVLCCEKEYPLAFSQLPSYTEAQRTALEGLAEKLGYDSPRWYLGTTPVE